jgi:hypothetical protein
MEQDWNGIKVYPDRSEIINAADDVVVVVHGEHHHRDARRILNLVDEVARLRDVIERWGYWKNKGGRERCYCAGDADCRERHEELCDLMNAMLRVENRTYRAIASPSAGE